mgnify:CR=1 FL=1
MILDEEQWAGLEEELGMELVRSGDLLWNKLLVTVEEEEVEIDSETEDTLGKDAIDLREKIRTNEAYITKELEIKPCPYCGGKAFVWDEAPHYVECENVKCKATGPLNYDERIAIAEWNQIACLDSRMSAANLEWLLEWIEDDNRKAPVLAFTAGPAREIADHFAFLFTKLKAV